MKKVSIETGSNYAVVRFQNLTLWTSYSTVIGFFTPKTGRVCRENSWGLTTGKHLNAIDGGDKKSRIAGADFEKQLADVLQAFGLSN
jgi:hypothetical protein